jgi:hypothetical protein
VRILRNIAVSCGIILLGQSATGQQMITFEDNSHNNQKKKKVVKANSVTLGVVSAFNGYLPLFYERKLTEFLSVQAGAGLTFRNVGSDVAQVLYDEGIESDVAGGMYMTGTHKEDITDDYSNYQYRKARPGIMLSIGPRVYFSDNVLDGFFLSPEVSFKSYKYAAQLADETYELENSALLFSDDNTVPRKAAEMDEFMNCMDYMLTIGGHYQKANSMAIAWSLSAGLRSFNAERLDVYVEYENYTYNAMDGKLRNAVHSYNGLKPLILFNLAIGGVF